MRQREYYLTEQFVNKLTAICNQRPTAASYDSKLKRLIVNDMFQFGQSIRQIDNRSLPTFLKRLKSIGFTLIQDQNASVYQWSKKSNFQLSSQIIKANYMVSTCLQKRRLASFNVSRRKQHINTTIQKLVFQLLILGKQQDSNWLSQIDSTVKLVQDLIKKTTMESIQSIDDIEKIGEQELFIYKNLLANQNQRG